MRPFALGAIPCRSLPDPRLSFTILCVKKGKCYDSVDNIEYIAYVSNDVRDVSLHRMSDMSLVVGDGLVLFSRKHKEVFHIHLRCKLCISY